MFTEIDNLFFSIVLKYQKYFNDINIKSLEYKLHINEDIIKLKTNNIIIVEKDNIKTPHKILLGIYNKEEELFKWFDSMNELTLEHLKLFDLLKFFNSTITIDKLFSNEVVIDNEQINAMMYFISIFNPAFNLIRFTSPDNNIIIYTLIDLNINLENNIFDFDDFIDDMDEYRNKVKNLIAG